MDLRRTMCGCLGIFLVLTTFTGRGDSASVSQVTQSKNATMKKLVEAYSANLNWTSLRTGLEPLLDRGSAACRQLRRIPADEQWPLKKASVVPGYLELVTLLLDAGLGADTTAGSHSSTMLHWAALGGTSDLASLLVSRGANLERRTSGGATALVLAARGGRTSLAADLLERGADPAAATHDGWTALHCAAARGDLELARRLVAAGAPHAALARTRWGSCTPLDIARVYEQPLVEEYLAALEAAS